MNLGVLPSTSLVASTGSALLQQLAEQSLIASTANTTVSNDATFLTSGLKSPSTLFTVEQLELIRRLRMTGISVEAVLQAFQTLEQMESNLELSRRNSIALAAMMAPTSTAPKLFSNQGISTPPETWNFGAFQNATTVTQNGLNSPPSLLQQLSKPLSQIQTNIDCTPVSTAANMSSSTSPEDMFANFNQTTPQIPTTSTSTSGNRPIRSTRTPMKEITTLDDPSELDEFMVQGEEACIQDMKTFIAQFSLRQTTVAMMTGVSQPYISKLLNGNHRELSLRCRKNIYSWYLNCRRHPEKLHTFIQDPSTRLETNGDGELIPQRRERYVFRPILIKILETFFTESPFPDCNKRAEIASACNTALQMDKKGVSLMPKEVVSPQVVANWFANKRKEMRRRSNEENSLTRAPASVEQPTATPSPHTPPDTTNSSLSSSSMEMDNVGNIVFGESLKNALEFSFQQAALNAEKQIPELDFMAYPNLLNNLMNAAAIQNHAPPQLVKIEP
uniref:Homeobox domain-containing protein n=1 Tax=Panagrellus redivivus TaxID=6233 RepID=A0A7E4VDS4_PANRE